MVFNKNWCLVLKKEITILISYNTYINSVILIYDIHFKVIFVTILFKGCYILLDYLHINEWNSLVKKSGVACLWWMSLDKFHMVRKQTKAKSNSKKMNLWRLRHKIPVIYNWISRETWCIRNILDNCHK